MRCQSVTGLYLAPYPQYNRNGNIVKESAYIGFRPMNNLTILIQIIYYV